MPGWGWLVTAVVLLVCAAVTPRGVSDLLALAAFLIIIIFSFRS